MSYLPQKPDSVFSTVNITTTPLGIGGTYTGTYESNDYVDLLVTVVADVDLDYYIDLSSDGVTADVSVPYEVRGGGINYPHRLTVGPRYVRLRIENNSGTAAAFTKGNIQFGNFNDLAIGQHRIAAQDNDATIVRPTDFRIESALGLRDGIQVFNAFGVNSDLDAGVPELVSTWGPTNFDPAVHIMSTAQTLTITYNNTTDGAGQTGARKLFIDYLDANDQLATAEHTLGSTGSDTSAFTCKGINLVRVIEAGTALKNVNTITLNATTDATTQAQVAAGASVSQGMIFHVPSTHSFIIDEVDFDVQKVGGTAPKLETNMYAYSRDKGVVYQLVSTDMDISSSNHLHVDFPNGFVIDPNNVVYITAESDTNNTIVKSRGTGVLHRV